jgi:hypothetical protein
LRRGGISIIDSSIEDVRSGLPQIATCDQGIGGGALGRGSNDLPDLFRGQYSGLGEKRSRSS